MPFSGTYYVDQGNGNVLGSQDLLAGYFDVTHNPWETANASNRGTSSFTVDLVEEFAGDLYLALDFTYGRVSYDINSLAWASSGDDTAPSNVPTPVPLPSTGWLLLAGFLGLAATRRKLD